VEKNFGPKKFRGKGAEQKEVKLEGVMCIWERGGRYETTSAGSHLLRTLGERGNFRKRICKSQTKKKERQEGKGKQNLVHQTRRFSISD